MMPAFSELEVRRRFGHSGRVSPSSSFSGGLSRISIWVREAAPWRLEVPMQSDPVSPPPMTTTCLPFALMNSVLGTNNFREQGFYGQL